jgi:hypothetical protein
MRYFILLFGFLLANPTRKPIAVFIMGMPGAGKTKLSKALAKLNHKRLHLLRGLDGEGFSTKVDDAKKKVMPRQYVDTNIDKVEFNFTEKYFNLIQIGTILPAILLDNGHDVVIEDPKDDGGICNYLNHMNPERHDIYFIQVKVDEETRIARRDARDKVIVDYSTLPAATDRFYDFAVENDGNFPEMAQKVVDYVLANKPDVVKKYYETFGKEIEGRRRAGCGTNAVLWHLGKRMCEYRK